MAPCTQAQTQAAEALLRQKAEQALQQADEAGRRAHQSKQQADQMQVLAEERRMQIAVVMDALETLQAGTPGKGSCWKPAHSVSHQLQPLLSA